MTRSTLDEASRWALTDEMTDEVTYLRARAEATPLWRGDDDNDWDDDDLGSDLFESDAELALYRLDPFLNRAARGPRSASGRTAGTLRRLGDAAYALAERTGRRA